MKIYLKKRWAKLTELYGNSIVLFLAWMLGIAAILCIVLLTFINSAAPTSLTMTAGEDGSIYQKYALKYQKILARQGVTITIVPSDGSMDNLNKLTS
ncbi:MAG: C4-dicarboxylate ABC transporter substrate-binding protein, partial [Methylotenera sp.]|nr:C4-dicarboxylate ABC transporter substrate-binding protein [Methylotenera sp.]